jgi:hypothetical protein
MVGRGTGDHQPRRVNVAVMPVSILSYLRTDADSADLYLVSTLLLKRRYVDCRQPFAGLNHLELYELTLFQ